MKNEKLNIFLVDDNVKYLKEIKNGFKEFPHFKIETFATGELCMAKIHEKPDIIITDYNLNAVDKTAYNGIIFLDAIMHQNLNIPVIVLSAQDKIEIAVSCMHHGAFDYVVKSETATIRLQKIIARIIEIRKMERKLNWYIDKM